MSYSAQAKAVLKALQKKGAAFVISRRDAGTYDEENDRTPSGTPKDYTAYGMALRPSGADLTRYAQMGLVLSQTKALLVAAFGLSIIPRPGDEFVWSGIRYTIRDVDPLAPDQGEAILYTVVGSK